MHINEDRERGTVIVLPVGRIDSATSEQLDRHLVGLDGAGEHRIVVDFGGVDYISSAGLRVMLTLAKRIRDRKGSLALCALGTPVRQVFELTGFLPLFVVTASREEAVDRTASA